MNGLSLGSPDASGTSVAYQSVTSVTRAALTNYHKHGG